MTFENNLKGVATSQVGQCKSFQVAMQSNEMVLNSAQMHHHPVGVIVVRLVTTSRFFVSKIVQVSSRKFEGALSSAPIGTA